MISPSIAICAERRQPLAQGDKYLGSGPDAQSGNWFAIEACYSQLRQDLSRLGGRLGTEGQSDMLWGELEKLFAQMAAQRAINNRQIALKLSAAVELMDEAENDAVRSLLNSAVDDLLTF